MKKYWFLLPVLAILTTARFFGQDLDGCVSSPENPTAILAVVGSAGAFFVSMRARIKGRRKSK